MIPVCATRFFRLPVCMGGDSVVVNTGRNSVSSLQLSSHKLHQSWTLKQPRSFSCPVVYHKNELLCAIDKHIVVTWNYEDDTLDGAKEIKFQDEIFAILPVKHHQLIVFNSGSCIMMEEAIAKHEYVMPSYLKNEENLLWVDISAYESTLFIFLLTSTCKGGHKLYSLLFNISDQKIEKLSEQLISRDSSTLQSWCMKSEDAEISFIVAWSDGQVHSYSKYNKSPVHLLTIPGVQEMEQLAVEALDSFHIVVVRYHASRGCSYEIWDTRYAARKTQESIDLTPLENLQIRVLDETLFILCSQGIIAEPLEVSPPTLAAALGKYTSMDIMPEAVYSWTSDGQLHREDVEETCKFSAITSNKVFQEFLARLDGQDNETVSSCLREVKCISESKLAELLQYLLRESSEFSKKSKKSSKRRRSVKKSERNTEKMFLEFFRIPHDDICLQQHLKKLTFKEILGTLKIVARLLRNIKHYDNSFSTYTLVVKWTMLLMSSHFVEICIATMEGTLVLQDILKSINEKLPETDNIEDLLQLKFEIPKSDRLASSEYSIEYLYL